MSKASGGRGYAGSNLLGIYLNDHVAGATAGLDLARRAAAAQRDREAGAALGQLADEIAEDRSAMLSIMAALGIQVRRYKVWAAWAAEKAGRLKANGRVVRRSPLSDLVELETLSVGVEGKASAWLALRALAESDSRLDAERLDELVARARRQADTLEGLRGRTAVEVFGATTPAP